MKYLVGILGLVTILGIAWLASNNRSKVKFRLIVTNDCSVMYARVFAFKYERREHPNKWDCRWIWPIIKVRC